MREWTVRLNVVSGCLGQRLHIAADASCALTLCLLCGRVPTAQVVIFERFVTVYKFISDAYFYVLSGHDENELITLSVLTCLEETVTNLLRYERMSEERHALLCFFRRIYWESASRFVLRLCMKWKAPHMSICCFRALFTYAVYNGHRNQVDKRTLIENLDLVLLSIDEIVDDG